MRECRIILKPLALELLESFGFMSVAINSAAYARALLENSRETTEIAGILRLEERAMHLAMVRFEQAYVAFEAAVLFQLVPAEGVAADANADAQEARQWLGVVLTQSLQCGISDGHYDREDVEDIDPAVMLSLPVYALLFAARNGLLTNLAFFFPAKGSTLATLAVKARDLSAEDYGDLVLRISDDSREESSNAELQEVYLQLAGLANELQSGPNREVYREMIGTAFRLLFEEGNPSDTKNKPSPISTSTGPSAEAVPASPGLKHRLSKMLAIIRSPRANASS